MKKKISLMMAMIILLQIVFPIITIVWESKFTLESIATEAKEIIFDGITWEYTTIKGKNEAIVKPKDGSSLYGVVTVPATLDGYSIVGLKENAFKDYKLITKIKLKKDIREIGVGAFSGCSLLSNIEVYDSNEYFSSEDGVLFNKEKTTLIKYPEGKLLRSSYTVPSTVTNIGQYSFVDTNVKNITIPNSVNTIGVFALTSSKLENITVNSGNATFKSTNGILFSKDGKKIICYPAGKTAKSYTIASGIESIEECAFANCDNLTSVKLPDTINLVRASSFYGCDNLKEINIPDGTTAIGQYAFAECKNLEKIIIPSSVTYIASHTFLNRSSKFTIYCKSGSYAETYAKNNDIPYEIIKLSNIEIVDSPYNTVYIEGEDFDKTGMIVNAIYNDGTSKVIENYTIENGTNLKKENTEVTIKYTEDGVTKTTIQDVMVLEKMVESIEITQAPSKTSYLAGQNFDKTGMKVVAIYNDGTSKEIQDYVVEDGEKLAEGKTSITITYMEDSVIASATQNITVLPNELKEIEITKSANKTEYIEGENFNPEGMIITATYEDGTNRTIDKYEVMYGSNLTTEKTSVMISYTEGQITKTVEQKIVVVEKILSDIELTHESWKTEYIEGENFNSEGIKITATYNNGTSKEIQDYVVEDGENLSVGKTNVTISYTEKGVTKATTQAITVAKKVVREIEIVKEPDKIEYIEGQNFNPEGMKVLARYNDETSKEITDYNITDGNALAVEKTNVTISYTEEEVTKTTTQAITVLAKSLVEIELKTTDAKLEYTSKERLNTEGLVIIAKYDNGTAEEIREGFECTPVELNEAGEQTITVTYGGKTATYTVQVTLRGDVDGNNKIDFMDMMKINKYRLGKIQLEGIKLKAADVTDDGKIDFMDMIQINKYRLGKINSL